MENRSVIIDAPDQIRMINVSLREIEPEEALVRIDYVLMDIGDFFPYLEKDGAYPAACTGECVGQIVRLAGECAGLSVGDWVFVHSAAVGMSAWSDGVRTQSALSDFMIVPAKVLYPLKGIPDLSLAPLCGPLTMAFQAINRVCGAQIPRRVVILGARLDGLALVACCRMLGVEDIIVADHCEQWLYTAIENGATLAVNVSAVSLYSAMRANCGSETNDVAFIADEAQWAWDSAVESISDGGTIVSVTKPRSNIVLDPAMLHRREISLISVPNNLQGFEVLVDAFGSGRLKFNNMVTKRFSFSETETAFHYVRCEASGILSVEFQRNRPGMVSATAEGTA